MRLGPEISARPLVLLRDYARQRCLDFDSLAVDAGLNPEMIAEPSAKVSCFVFATLLERMAEQTDDPAFALGYVQTLPTRPAGVYQTIVFHSETLRDAFRAMSRFSGQVTDALTISYDEHGDCGGLTFRFSKDLATQRQFIAGQLGIIAVRARQLLGNACRLKSVRFAFPDPGSTERYGHLFGPCLSFEQRENSILYGLDVLHQKLPHARTTLDRQIDSYAQDKPLAAEREKFIAVRVAQFIAGALQRGEANETQACRSLGVGRRTLQRDLAEAGTTFRDILQHERARLAQQYLLDTELSLAAISLLLGYSELSAFSRASRQWFGMSPSALRQSRCVSARSPAAPDI